MTMTTMTTMRIEAYAKLNLTLEVFGIRSDGYHALRSLVVPISLSDTLEIEDSVALSSDVGYPDDLCLKAARTLRSVGAGTFMTPRSPGAAIRVTKRIPAGGGLGGGSADAAATLIALNEIWGLLLSRADLADIGAQVGSDVPALVTGGPVVMEGRGEKVTSVTCPTLHFVLANPGVNVSTKDVYALCEGRRPDAPSATAEMLAAVGSGDLERVAALFVNDLQAPASRLHPEISDAVVSLRTAGALGVSMSGSGSSVFGLVPDAATAERIASEMNARGLRSWPVRTL